LSLTGQVLAPQNILAHQSCQEVYILSCI